MTTETQSGITGNFDLELSGGIPHFAKGEDTKALCEEVSKTLKSGVWYDEDTKTMKGSSLPLVARVDSIVRPLGIRVANLPDLSKEGVMSKVRGRFYSDTPAIVMRSTKDSYDPNLELIPGLANHVEQAQGALRQPILITGFDVVPANNKYGWDIVPRDDFKVIEDDRLDGKHGGKKFSEVDENGLPKFDKKGNRTWYARDQGLSRLYLGRDLDLSSFNEDLAYSGEGGRVVLISGEASAPDFTRKYAETLRAEADARKSELDAWLNKSLDNIPGGRK